MPEVSVIIPCYNQGHWLEEAVASVLMQDYEDYEVIVIDDGSTDPFTRAVIERTAHPRLRKKTIANQGLAGARNEGVKLASGRYILPLDSDDRIAPSYVRKAVEILKAQPDVGIVYCKAELFGEESGVWEVEDYAFPDILISPRIFASAMYRREDWERAGGYRADMIHGWEDYDFWLSLIGLGLKVHRIDEVLFHYRRTQGSMAGLDRGKALYSYRKLFEHHRALYEQNIGILFESVIDAKPVRDLRRSRGLMEVHIPDEANAYAGRNRREQYYPEGVWARVSLLLDRVPDAGIHLLRIDPCQTAAVLDVASVRLLDPATGECLWDLRETGGGEACAMGPMTFRIPHEQFLRVFCANADGHFFLPRIPRGVLDRPLLLEVWLMLHPDLRTIGEWVEALVPVQRETKLVDSLKGELKQLREDHKTFVEETLRLREHATQWETRGMLAQTEANKIHAEAKLLQAENHRIAQDRDYIQRILDGRDREIADLKQSIEAMRNRCADEMTGLRGRRSSWWKRLLQGKNRRG